MSCYANSPEIKNQGKSALIIYIYYRKSETPAILFENVWQYLFEA